MSLATPARAGRSAFRAMGTEVVILAPDERMDAVAAVDSLFAEWDAHLSRFRPGSELAALNATAGRPVPVGDLLFEVTEVALEAAQATDGLFDPLLGVALSELGYDRTFDELPPDALTPDRLSDWEAGMWRQVRLDPQRRTVELPFGTALDLGGIAKGMAVDAALERLRTLDVPWAAVSAGGDMAVTGVPPGRSAWSVEIDGGLHHVVGVTEGAVATSSVLSRTWRVNGERRHHIIDPRTGLPARTGLELVSVAAASCREAEVAAKAALLLGAAAGASFLEQNGLSALLVTERHSEWRVGTWH